MEAQRRRVTIVSTDYSPKRARKRKQSPAIPMRIVTARKPGPAASAIKEAVTEQQNRPAQAAAITCSRIVTARKPGGRFHDVPDMTPEEHQRRRDAAEALFRAIVRRATGDGRT